MRTTAVLVESGAENDLKVLAPSRTWAVLQAATASNINTRMLHFNVRILFAISKGFEPLILPAFVSKIYWSIADLAT